MRGSDDLEAQNRMPRGRRSLRASPRGSKQGTDGIRSSVHTRPAHSRSSRIRALGGIDHNAILS